MTSVNPPSSSFWAWLSLVRIPAIFTVIAQVAAAFACSAGSFEPVARLVVVLIAAICLYWAGMILNDVWDVETDRLERPGRPLPSGAIAVSTARNAAWALLIAGVGIAGLSGFVPAAGYDSTWCPAIVAVATAISIVLYNGLLKQTVAAPIVMGLCRALCFLLGASPVVIVAANNIGEPAQWFAPWLVAAAVGMGLYIMGVTTISRSETTGGNLAEIVGGFVGIILGAIAMAISPQFADAANFWAMLPRDRFMILMVMITLPIAVRGFRVVRHAEPAAVQNLVRAGVMTLIPFSAAFALLAAGPAYGLAVLALFIPAVYAAARFRVT